MRRLALVVVVSLVSCAAPQPQSVGATGQERVAAHSATDVTYDVTVAAGPVLHIEACGADAFAPVDARAKNFAIVKDEGRAGACTSYQLNLGEAASALRSRDSAVWADDVVLTSPDVWLWTTSPPSRGTLRLHMAEKSDESMAASVPFPQAKDGSYVVDPTTWRFLSIALFGEASSYERRAIALGDARIEVAILPGERAWRGIEIERAVSAAATAVSLGAGRRAFPVDRALVVIQPVLGAGVPFGMVTRGGGAQVTLLVGAQARVDDIVSSWVPVHELSHLLHPYLRQDDAWFGEGYASYQQQVLRARAGITDDATAWAGLLDGFARGAAAADRMPLAVASSRMRQDGRWLQVYWGGAVIALWLDVTLRRCGEITLDDVVREVRERARDQHQARVDAMAVVVAAEAHRGPCAPLQPQVQAMLSAPFPEQGREILRSLGVKDGGGFDDTAPLSSLRRQITARHAVTW